MWTIEKLRRSERIRSSISILLLVIIPSLMYPIFLIITHFWGEPDNYYFAIFLVTIIPTSVWGYMVACIISPLEGVAEELDTEPSLVFRVFETICFAAQIVFFLLAILVGGAGWFLQKLVKSSVEKGGGFIDKLLYLIAAIIVIFFIYMGIKLLWQGNFLDAIKSLP